jgi:hypothetical protein
VLTLRASAKSLPFRLSGPDGATAEIDRRDFPPRAWLWRPIRVGGRMIGSFVVRGHPMAGNVRVTLDIPPEWRVLRADQEPTRQTTHGGH